MGSAVWLNCTGLDDLDAKTHSEVVVRLRQVLEPLCKDAGKTLTITKGDHRGDLNLDFDSDTDTRARDLCPSSGLGNLLGEDAGIEQAKPEQSDDGTAPGKHPSWALPAGAAAALLLAVGVGFAFWPDRSRVSDADPFLMTKPVWDDKQETQAPQQMAAAQVQPPLALKSKQ